MGRTVKIRKTYQQDVAALTRLASAVDLDPKRPPKWKMETVQKINEVIMLLLQQSLPNTSKR